MKERGLFDEEERLNILSKLGDNLETLNKKINWELFRPILRNISDEHSRISNQ